MSLGKRIKEQRKKCGLSQEKVAELVGVSRQAVTKWEVGQSAPSTENLFRLAEIFGTTVDILLDSEETDTKKQRQIKYQQGLLVACVLLLLTHILLSFLGYVKILSVVLLPGVIVALAIILHFVFKYVSTQNEYNIIAGYDEQKDNVKIIKRQFNTIDLLNLVFVIFFNILFFANYAFQGTAQYLYSAILLGIYILIFVIIIVGVNVKMKSRS